MTVADPLFEASSTLLVPRPVLSRTNRRESTDVEIDDSDRDDEVKLDDCEINSTDSDEVSLSEVQRRNMKKKRANRRDLSVAHLSKSTTSGASSANQTEKTQPISTGEQHHVQTPLSSFGNETTNDTDNNIFEELHPSIMTPTKTRKRKRNEASWKRHAV